VGVLRTIECPSCTARRTVKAGAGTRLVCGSCGHIFRAPPPAEPVSTVPAEPVGAEGVSTPAAAADTPSAPAKRSSVKVERAGSTTVTSTPRATTAPAKKASKKRAPAKPVDRSKTQPAKKPAVPAPAPRRGAAGLYNRTVRGSR
jgi:hypothetical protein